MSLYDNLKISILPLDIIQGDKSTNINNVKSSMQNMPEGTDVFVLPELFSTGYISDKEKASELAEKNTGETIDTLTELSSRYKVAICGSFLAKTGNALYNRGFIIEPNGDATFYDKRHLFCISEETKVCNKGRKLPPVVRFRGWNICLAICYDLRFPLWLRNVDNKYDALILPANWPDKRSYAWHQLLKARAIENEAYVIGADRSGTDDFGTYNKQSQVYDYMGIPIGTDNGNFIVVTLNRPTLQKFREHFPVWRDSDHFKIEL